MENNNYRGIPTSLFLNGPKLGIVTDPQSVSNVIGVATFTGIATASFPDGGTTVMKAGDIFYVPSRPHDSWVVGDEPYVSIHFLGANSYAK